MTFSYTSLSDYHTDSEKKELDSKKSKVVFNGSLIKFGDFTILLDPGWISKNQFEIGESTNNHTEKKDQEYENGLISLPQTKDIYQSLIDFWTPIIENIDLILISQSSIDCLGSYSFIFTHFQSLIYHKDIKVYSTLPVMNLGRVSTIELYCGLQLTGPFYDSKIDIEDIESSFDYIVSLKYSQMINIQQFKMDKLSFTAYSSGNSVGGCSYSIESSQEKIVYSPRWCHTKDTLINGTQMLDPSNNLTPIKSLMKPSCFIGSMKYTAASNSLPLRRKVNNLKKYLKENLYGNNCILIPTSIGLDFLNIFVLLNDYFNEMKGRRSYNTSNNNYNASRTSQNQQQQPHPLVYLVSYSKGRSLTYAKSMLEWLSNDIVKQWQLRDNKTPFDLDLKVLSPKDFENQKNSIIMNGGVIFVADNEILFNQVLTSFSSNNQMLRNCYVLMTSSFIDSELLQDMLKACEKDIEYDKIVELKEYQSLELENDDLASYNEFVQQRHSKRKALRYEYQTIQEAHKKQNLNDLLEEDSDDEENEEESDDDEGDDEEEEENEEGDKKGQEAKRHKKDKEKNKDQKDNLNSKDSYKEDGETKIPMDFIIKENAPVKQQMFPYKISKIFQKDEYGQVVDFSQFIPIDETEDDYVLEGLKRTRSGANDANKYSDNSDNEEEEEDDDDYDPTNPVSKKTSNKKQASEREKEALNFDDISYLEPLNSKPAKDRLVTKRYKVTCKIEYIDLTSYVDQRSMDIILPSFQPRKLLFIESGGFLEKQYPNIETLFIKDNEEHVFTTTIKTLDITLSQELENMIHWQTVLGGKYKISNVTGKLVKIFDKTKEGITDANRISNFKLELKPIEDRKSLSSGQEHSNTNLHLGDVKLNQLKDILTQKNHKAQFTGDGTLVVDNTVFIKKISDSITVIDGKPSKLFYLVKKTVTDTLATI